MENENEGRLDRVKRHLKDNKKTYLIGAGCLAAGVFLRKPGTIAIINNVAPNITPSIAPVFNSAVNNGGHMRKIVKCLDTGELWLSVTDAAKSQGKNIALMSQHLNHPDVVPEINGLKFVIEALATN